MIYTIRRPDDYTDSSINQRFKDLRAPDIATDRPLPTPRHVTEWEELLGEMSTPVPQALRNVDANPTKSAETLAAICEGFTSGYLGKILAY